jgi:DNA-binding MarR family transcriptional regulator
MSAGKGKLKLVEADISQEDGYHLQEQVGFILRKASQRHIAIFARHIGDLTPPQFAALAKLAEIGEASQNQLGALVAMDAATIKGVIDRLKARGLVALSEHKEDKRRLVVSLSDEGRALIERLLPLAERITAETLAPLNARETATFLKLLAKLA